MLTSNDNAFKGLQAFFSLRFLDANVHAHCITRLELGDVVPELGILKII